MGYANTGAGGFFRGLFSTSPAKRERRKHRAEERRKKREADLKSAKALRDSGYFDNHLPDASFYRHYYF